MGIARVGEGVRAVGRIAHALMDMHAASAHAFDGLWHEGPVEPVALGDRLERQAKSDHIIRGR